MDSAIAAPDRVPVGGVVGHALKEYDIATNGISLRISEQGEGSAVLFCHGFPDTSYTWRRQMTAIASAGYRAIAPDMRGYGRSSAPAAASLYTPMKTVGDLVGVLDELKIPSAVLVGHDWGITSLNFSVPASTAASTITAPLNRTSISRALSKAQRSASLSFSSWGRRMA